MRGIKDGIVDHNPEEPCRCNTGLYCKRHRLFGKVPEDVPRTETDRLKVVVQAKSRRIRGRGKTG